MPPVTQQTDHYSSEDLANRKLGTVDQYPVVDLFPYKFKNLDNFIFRDHIPFREDDPVCEEYAIEQWRRIIEGHWVFDFKEGEEDKGTWVWMMPKLYTYINFSTVNIQENAVTKELPPRMRDNEIIMLSYILCCDGFSGFMDDPDFTCNRNVKTIEEGGDVPPYVLQKLEKHCKKSDGTWKTYVEAWEYITSFYLVDNPRPFPLGKPLYENTAKNGMIMGSRGIAKTFVIAGADSAHEFLSNGARYVEDLLDDSKTFQFIGSSDRQYVSSFLTVLKLSIDNFPGKKFPKHKLFYKPHDGEWSADRGEILQRFRKADNTYGGSHSEISKAILLPNKKEVMASKRYRRVYIDEVGLQDNIELILQAGADAMRATEGKSGSAILTGTGGNVDKIAGTKKIFYDPNQFDVYSIPNYWVDGRPIGLFISTIYAEENYKIEGNTDLIGATHAVIKERKEASGGDNSKISGKRMNRPMIPSEIFLGGKSDYFDKDLVADRIEMLETGLWENNSEVVELSLGKPTPDGLYDVIVVNANKNRRELVTDPHDVKIGDREKRGGIIIYERPRHDGTGFLEMHNLYKTVYDPKTDIETGESWASYHVYKGLKNGMTPGEKANCIVASAKIKLDDDENHMAGMLLCLWYKSKLQYERNVSGIPSFFNKYGLGWILQPTPLAYIKDVTPGTTQRQQSGIVMTDQLKQDALRLLRKQHREIVDIDPGGNVIRWVDTQYDLALLYEMLLFDSEGNFDSISSMLILMLWLAFEHMPENSKFSGDDDDTDWDDFFNAGQELLIR